MLRYLLPLVLAGCCSLAACKHDSNTNPGFPEVPTSASASNLVAVAASDTIWNGVTVSDDNRIFVLYPHNEGSAGTRIAELVGGKAVPWPSRAWNAWKQPGDPIASAFVRPNSLRIGPDGLLWIVDTGTPRANAAPLAGGPRLLGFNYSTGQLMKSIELDDLVKTTSFVDDLRFHGDVIYVTDAGAPAILVLNQRTGQRRRVLENDTTTTQRRPLYGEGKKLVLPNGLDATLHADQMELSPDGKYYYYQSAAGPMYRIETQYIENFALAPADLAKQVKYFFNSPTCGGTTIDAQGNLYVADANQKRVLKVTPDGQSSTLVQRSDLVWVDAMWIDRQGNLWMPLPQQNRTAGFQQGVQTVQFPVQLYRLPIGAQPFRD